MVRPTAAQLTVPLSRAKDLTPLASILHVLGTRSRWSLEPEALVRVACCLAAFERE